MKYQVALNLIGNCVDNLRVRIFIGYEESSLVELVFIVEYHGNVQNNEQLASISSLESPQLCYLYIGFPLLLSVMD